MQRPEKPRSTTRIVAGVRFPPSPLWALLMAVACDVHEQGSNRLWEDPFELVLKGGTMILFWRIRYLDTHDQEFKDRDLWLDTDDLDSLTRAAVEATKE